jgi:hypothetical protein
MAARHPMRMEGMMSVYDRDFTKISPKVIATECSPVHIENILNAMQDEIALLKREKMALAEQLRRADHTLSVHGHIDADTDLHRAMAAAVRS